jgi:transmembrane sensor
MSQTLLAELLSAYGELRRWLARRLGNPQDAADVAQSSFEQVYAYAAATPVASPRALLFRAARSLCIDRGRRRQVEARAFEELHAAPPASAPSAEQLAQEREALAGIGARLARLPRKRREAFVLVRVYGYSHAEVAARLGISSAAVEKHIVRANLALAEAPPAVSRAGRMVKAGTALVLALLAFAGVRWHLAQPLSQEHISAAPAQIVRARLADGSSLELAGGTQLRVALYRDRRAVRFTGGEARFDVAADASRPFVIETRVGQVRVIGTVFTVRDRGAGVIVSVERGRVAFAGVELTAGERIEVVQGRAGPVQRRSAAPWRSGWMVFDDVPLAEALAEINAWRREPLHLADQRAGAERLTGSFPVGDPDGALDLLRGALPIEIRRGAQGPEIALRP